MLVRYAGKRLLAVVPQLVIITAAVFFLIRLLPADPTARIVGLDPSPQAYQHAKESLGLDRSLLEQFGTFAGGIVHLDLGRSWLTDELITTDIARLMPITLQLIVLSFLIALVVAIPLGIVSAMRPGRLIDKTIFGYGLFAGAQPDFWWGIMFSLVFTYKLEVFPVPIGIPPLNGTPITGFSLIDAALYWDWPTFGSILMYYLLPSLTLAFIITGPIVKMLRQNMIGVLQSDFILYAHACGLPSRRIAWRAVRAALMPVVTLVGILFGFSLGGAVLIETIFSINGLGQYAVQHTLALDYPAMQGVVLVMTGFGLLVYLTMDLLYAIVDPRIRY